MTSPPWTGGPRPLGVYSIDREAAASIGQSRPFTCDLRRTVTVPVTVGWFPDLNAPDQWILGHAPVWHRNVYESVTRTLASIYKDNIEGLATGPLSLGR